jgi:CRISPR/Cas system CSM-associated protein Csm5 (group 7 of RAMP superfamily)
LITLHFTTLTPLHISNGDEIEKWLHYCLLNEKKLCKFNFLHLTEIIAKENIFDFKKDYDLEEIKAFLKDYLNNLYNKGKLNDNYYFYYKVGLDENFKQHYKNKNAVGEACVKEFINSNGKFYIPASSVKGAILTVLNAQHLGIDPNNATIVDKFVLCDTEFIDENNFEVKRFHRPPPVNILCLKENVSFKMKILKKGNLNFDILKRKLKTYSTNQIDKAETFIKKFENSNVTKKPPTGETLGSKRFIEALQKIRNKISALNDNEYPINLGYGGGAYFKIFENVQQVPRNTKGEYIHTSFSTINDFLHIGWCKLKIEEP